MNKLIEIFVRAMRKGGCTDIKIPEEDEKPEAKK